METEHVCVVTEYGQVVGLITDIGTELGHGHDRCSTRRWRSAPPSSSAGYTGVVQGAY